MSNQSSNVTKVYGWETFKVRFDGFESFLNGVMAGHDSVDSPEFSCFGHQWLLNVYCDVEDWDDICVSLRHRSLESIKILHCVSIRSSNGKEIVPCPEVQEETLPSYSIGQCIDRSKIMDALVEGALVIEVRMKQAVGTDPRDMPFVPENPFCKMMHKKFLDEKSADVVFEVGSDEVRSVGNKRAKNSPTVFHAHRFILQECASTLADLCTGGDLTPVPITDVTPDIFRHVLYYVYGGKLTDEDLETNAKEIVDAADKYGVANLKLEAEECYVRSTAITLDNVMDNILYADSKNCALLKEKTMDFIVENREEAIKKLSFENFPGHLVKDLLTAMGMEKKEEVDAGNLSNARVSTLRRMLHEKGLDIDGSREAMTALLEQKMGGTAP